MRPFAFLALAFTVASCASAAAPPRHDYRSQVAVGTESERETAPTCAQLPEAVGGFRLGHESSFGRVGTRCIDEGFEWTQESRGGLCSGTPLSVGPASWARFNHCGGSRVCALTIGFTVGGQTALQRAAADRLAQLTERYGEGVWQLDAARPCPRVEGDEFGCVLDGVGLVIVRWHVDDPDDGQRECRCVAAGAAPDSGGRQAAVCPGPRGVIELRVEGDRGTHDATVTTTYAQRAAIDTQSESHL
jgi:hypothetical protein